MSNIGYHWETKETTEEIKEETKVPTFYERHQDEIDTLVEATAFMVICYLIAIPFVWICSKFNKNN